MAVVDTVRANRRQDMGGGRWREHGELVPEFHTWSSGEHWLHTGELTEAKGVEEAEFRAAVEKYCPQLAEQIYMVVGLTPGVHLDAAGRPRAGDLVPQNVPESMRAGTVKVPEREGVALRAEGDHHLEESTILATQVPPGAETGAAVVPRDKENAVAYEDRTTVDPSQLNAALTGTRPADIERHEEAIAAARDELVATGRPLDADRERYAQKLEQDRDKPFLLSNEAPPAVSGPGEGNLADGPQTEGVNDLPPGTAASEGSGSPLFGSQDSSPVAAGAADDGQSGLLSSSQVDTDDEQGTGGQPPAGDGENAPDYVAPGQDAPDTSVAEAGEDTPVTPGSDVSGQASGDSSSVVSGDQVEITKVGDEDNGTNE